VPLSCVLGYINLPAALGFLALAVLAGICLSLSAMLLEDMAFRRFVLWRDFLRLVAFSVLENFGYRQVMTAYRVRGFWSYLRGNHSWGVIERRGFDPVPELPASVGMR
jgi:hypothetical protein